MFCYIIHHKHDIMSKLNLSHNDIFIPTYVHLKSYIYGYFARDIYLLNKCLFWDAIECSYH